MGSPRFPWGEVLLAWLGTANVAIFENSMTSLTNSCAIRWAQAREVAIFTVYQAGLYTAGGVVLIFPYVRVARAHGVSVRTHRVIIDLFALQHVVAQNGHAISTEELAAVFDGGEAVHTRRQYRLAALYFGRGPLTYTPGVHRMWDISTASIHDLVEQCIAMKIVLRYPIHISRSLNGWPDTIALSDAIIDRHHRIANQCFSPWVWGADHVARYLDAQAQYLYTLYTHRIRCHKGLLAAAVSRPGDDVLCRSARRVVVSGVTTLLDERSLPINLVPARLDESLPTHRDRLPQLT